MPVNEHTVIADLLSESFQITSVQKTLHLSRASEPLLDCCSLWGTITGAAFTLESLGVVTDDLILCLL